MFDDSRTLHHQYSSFLAGFKAILVESALHPSELLTSCQSFIPAFTPLCMPKVKAADKAGKGLRHAPLGAAIASAEDTSKGKLKTGKQSSKGRARVEEDEDAGMEEDAARDGGAPGKRSGGRVAAGEGGVEAEEGGLYYDSDEYDDDVEDDADAGDEDMVDFDGEYVEGVAMDEEEEELVNRFLHAGKAETRTLADIIMSKIKEKEEHGAGESVAEEEQSKAGGLPVKVQEVYQAVGKLLAHYKTGKLPKALKMLPHLRNWEEVLWLTRPDQWSPSATFAITRIFTSNLNEKMSQRFLNLVVLEKCRDDIRRNNKLNFHLYLACKKALFKPAAFYKGFLLPLVMSRTCSLREATIIGSILAKVSIPANHSSAALLKLAEMPYSGSNSLFIKILLNKKYALPRRVVDAVVNHFCAFDSESRVLPVRICFPL